MNVTQYTYIEPTDYTRCLTVDNGTLTANYSEFVKLDSQESLLYEYSDVCKDITNPD